MRGRFLGYPCESPNLRRHLKHNLQPPDPHYAQPVTTRTPPPPP